MSIGNVKIMDDAVTEDKLETTAAKTIKLSDVAGVDSFTVTDSDNKPVFKIMSDGTIKTRKGLTRL